MTTRRRILLGLAAGTLASACAQERLRADPVLPLAGQRLRFASVAEGRRVLAADDDWLPVTGGFQRRAMMASAHAATLTQFRQ